MPSLERFFSPSVRFLDANLKSLPGSKLYFFKAGSSTPKETYADKVGNTANANPVVADANGIFPPIFLSGLYRVELRSASNIVQPGWPIDNVGQDSAIVPFAPWSVIVTYQTDDVVTASSGDWYRSKVDDNLGNDPISNSDEWELIIIPVAANFVTSVPWATWSDTGTEISLDIDKNGLREYVGVRKLLTSSDDLKALPSLDATGAIAMYYWTLASIPANSPIAVAGFAFRRYSSAAVETIVVTSAVSRDQYVANKDSSWTAWDKYIRQSNLDSATSGLASYSNDRVTAGGDFDGGMEFTVTKVGDQVTMTSGGSLTHISSSQPTSGAGVIPAAYRPTAEVRNAYSIRSGTDIRTVKITTAGTVELEYMDFTGALTASTGTGGTVSITYNITGSIA